MPTDRGAAGAHDPTQAAAPAGTARTSPDAHQRERSLHLGVAATAAVLALTARAVPLLRGGGLTGRGNYDDGVYYSAGTALLHGLLPYRDYLFLHPPGIVVALAPFGIAGLTGHDALGLATARVVWMLLGALNTVLVARILRPAGLFAAATGALFYATAFPAIYIEWTPLLEGPAQTCVLAAVLLLTRASRPDSPPWLAGVLGGVLLGLSATFKIWGVVPVLTVAAWCLVTRRRSTGVAVVAGSAAAIGLVCLPFFVAAPGRMWRMVVIDQLGRGRSAVSAWARLADIVGLGRHPLFATPGAALFLALLLAAIVLGAAATVPQARLCAVLTLSLTVLLLAGPSWFLHYPGLDTGPFAVIVGAGVATILRWSGRRSRWSGWLAAGVAAGVLAYSVAPLAGLRLGRPFPDTELSASPSLRSARCVTSDDPTALVALNVLTRDLDNGCRFVADVGGYSYQFAAERGGSLPRNRDPRWQRFYLDLLRSGQLALPYLYSERGALSTQTLATIASWPERGRAGHYVLRSPR